MTLPIRTERLLLRRFAEGDVPDIVAFLDHPSVARATPEIEGTEAGALKYVQMQNGYAPFEQDKCFDLAIERAADGKVMGLLTMIRRKHQQGEIGYALGIEFRGQGYATEAAGGAIDYAFSTLELHRIQAETSSDNPSSYEVMERLGMRREGQMREAESREDAWVDKLVYGILDREWRGRR